MNIYAYPTRRHVIVDNQPFQLKELIPFAGALITGAVGGCVASVQHARTRRETVAAFAVGYMITGAFGGLVALAGFNVFYPSMIDSWSSVFLVAGLCGMGTALAVAAGNISMRVVMKKLGWDVTVEVKRIDKDDAR